MTITAEQLAALATAALNTEMPDCEWCDGKGYRNVSPENELSQMGSCSHCDATGKQGGELAMRLMAGLKAELRYWLEQWLLAGMEEHISQDPRGYTDEEMVNAFPAEDLEFIHEHCEPRIRAIAAIILEEQDGN